MRHSAGEAEPRPPRLDNAPAGPGFDAVPPALTLDALFSSVARMQPDAIAIESDVGLLTYGALDQQAEDLARRLSMLGLRAGGVAAIVLPRSIEMIVAMLAVLKAGGAYLPLDPHLPAERLGFMIEDASAQLLIGAPEAREKLWTGGRPLPPFLSPAQALAASVDDNALPVLMPQADPCALAYVMYTSGSTGQPKGAEVTHASIVNLAWRPSFAEITPQDVILQAAPVAFDASTFEIWGALLNGARLRLIPEGPIDLDQLAVTLARSGVTVAWLTAGLFGEVASHHLPLLAGLKHLLTGGDVLPVGAVARVMEAYPQLRLTNGYGPTETTVFATTHDIVATDLAGPIPIGRPLRNVQVPILDPELRPVPPGQAGELYISGAGVALGYRRRPDLTAERFVRGPAGERLYRTGDLARLRASDEVIEFLGRADRQIKIRGFRIEPGEIEAALIALPQIAEACVQPRTMGGELRLVAYLVGSHGVGAEEAVVREALKLRLPDYMLPSACIWLDRLPLTVNGKLDRDALPDPAASRTPCVSGPANETEAMLCGLFGQIIGQSEVGPLDDFFLLGGHSLAAMRLAARVQTETGRSLGVSDIFEHRTPRALARVLASGSRREPLVVTPGAGLVGGQPALSLGQARLWLLDRIQSGAAAYNIPVALELEGPLDKQALDKALADLVDRHPPLRTSMIDNDGAPAGRLIALTNSAPLLVVETVDGEAQWAGRLRDALARPFDAAGEPMLRAHLYRLDPERHVLGLVLHHAAADGESLPILLGDLSAAYAARCAGTAPGLPAQPLTYSDFAAAQRSWLESAGEQSRQLSFWRRELANAPLLDLPTDHPRLPQRSRRAGEAPIRLSPSLARQLRQRADRSSVTLFCLLTAAYGRLLAQASGSEDVVVGVAVAGRDAPGLDDLVGLFVNILPLRLKLDGTAAPANLIAATRSRLVDLLSNADAPFERIVQATACPRREGENPLFQAAITWQGAAPGTGADFPGLVARPRHVPAALAKFDLTLSLHPATDGGIGGALEYDASLFGPATARRWAAQWLRILRGLARDTAWSTAPNPTAGGTASPQPARAGSPIQAATGETVALLQRLFGEVTGVDEVDADDDFFLIGGHSLSAMRLVARIKAETGLAFPPALLFGNPTPQRCAAAWDAMKARPDDLAQTDGARPFFCVPGIGGSVLSLRHLAAAFKGRPFAPLGAMPDDPIGEDVEQIAARHVAAVRLRQPQGPYLLGGYSFGGLVAYDMARQLRAQGEEVALLAIIDSRWPRKVRTLGQHVYALWSWIGNLPALAADQARSTSWSQFPDKFARLAMRTFDKLRGRAPRLETIVAGAALVAANRALWESHLAAADRYAPEICPFPIALFRARAQPVSYPWVDRAFGWGAAASGPVPVHMIAGNHVSIIGAKAPLLAAELLAALDRAAASL